MIIFFWKAIAVDFRLKQPRFTLYTDEGSACSLQSGLVGLNSTAVRGKIGPGETDGTQVLLF